MFGFFASLSAPSVVSFNLLQNVLFGIPDFDSVPKKICIAIALRSRVFSAESNESNFLNDDLNALSS